MLTTPAFAGPLRNVLCGLDYAFFLSYDEEARRLVSTPFPTLYRDLARRYLSLLKERTSPNLTSTLLMISHETAHIRACRGTTPPTRYTSHMSHYTLFLCLYKLN